MYTPSYPSRYFTLPTLAGCYQYHIISYHIINIMFIFLSLFLFLFLFIIISLFLFISLFIYPLFLLFIYILIYSLLYTGVEPVLLDWKAKVLDRWTNRAVTVKTTVPYLNIPSYSPTSHLALYPLFNNSPFLPLAGSGLWGFLGLRDQGNRQGKRITEINKGGRFREVGSPRWWIFKYKIEQVQDLNLVQLIMSQSC